MKVALSFLVVTMFFVGISPNYAIKDDADCKDVIDMDSMLNFPEKFVDKRFNIQVKVKSVTRINTNLYRLNLINWQTKEYVFNPNFIFVIDLSLLGPTYTRLFQDVISGADTEIHLNGILIRVKDKYIFYAITYANAYFYN